MRERLEDEVREEWREREGDSNREPLEGDPEGMLRLRDHDLGMERDLSPSPGRPQQQSSSVHVLLSGRPPQKAFFGSAKPPTCTLHASTPWLLLFFFQR